MAKPINLTNGPLPPGIETREDVMRLQRDLNSKGANLTVDGLYGDKTDAALKNATSSSGSGRSTGSSSGGNTGHPSEYDGAIVEGKDGKSYTTYGALLREDGFYYPSGAIISPNGMYYDIGNGWQFAKQAVTYNKAKQEFNHAPGDMTGAAPGTVVKGFERTAFRGGSTSSADADTEQPDNEEEPSLWEQYFDEQLELYNKERLSGYGM